MRDDTADVRFALIDDANSHGLFTEIGPKVPMTPGEPMPATPAPSRLDAARRLTDLVLDPHVDTARLDAVVDRAATSLHARSAQLSLLGDCQVTGAVGGASEAPRGSATAYEDTICAWTLRTDEPLFISDARLDARVSSIPAVRSGDVVAYAGVPLRAEVGIVAVLCVFDPEPREWQDADVRLLSGFADEVQAELARLTATSGAA